MIFNVELIRDGDLLPKKATEGASGYDLKAALGHVINPGDRELVPCGFRMELSPGWEAQVRARSGLAMKKGISIVNGIGTIDADYRGEIACLLINHGKEPFTIAPGDRIGQMVLVQLPKAALVQGKVFDDTARGAGGFGSTGVR